MSVVRFPSVPSLSSLPVPQYLAVHHLLSAIEMDHSNMDHGGMDHGDMDMGGQCALLKVQASKTFEFCAREASQIFGGNSIVKEGRGKVVERLYREVRAAAIPGGAEEILLDFAMRQSASKAKKLLKRSKL